MSGGLRALPSGSVAAVVSPAELNAQRDWVAAQLATLSAASAATAAADEAARVAARVGNAYATGACFALLPIGPLDLEDLLRPGVEHSGVFGPNPADPAGPGVAYAASGRPHTHGAPHALPTATLQLDVVVEGGVTVLRVAPSGHPAQDFVIADDGAQRATWLVARATGFVGVNPFPARQGGVDPSLSVGFDPMRVGPSAVKVGGVWRLQGGCQEGTQLGQLTVDVIRSSGQGRAVPLTFTFALHGVRHPAAVGITSGA